MDKKTIKLKDGWAIELGKTLTGYKLMLDDIAKKLPQLEHDFWGRVREKCKLDPAKQYKYTWPDKITEV